MNRLVKDLFTYERSHEYYKWSRFFSMLYVVILMAATVLAYKVIALTDKINIPASTFIFTSSYFIAMIITELYGPNIAKKVIWESLVCGYIFALLIVVMLWLPSPSFWNHQDAYEFVLGHVLRFTIAGSLGFLLSNFLAVFLLQKWRILLRGKWFSLRSLGATTLGEFIATYFVGVFTFWGLMPLSNILAIMTTAFLYKIILNTIIVWPVSFFVVIIRKFENHTYQVNSSIVTRADIN